MGMQHTKMQQKGVSMRGILGALMRNAHLMHYNAHKCTGMRTGENDTAYGRERHVTPEYLRAPKQVDKDTMGLA